MKHHSAVIRCLLALALGLAAAPAARAVTPVAIALQSVAPDPNSRSAPRAQPLVLTFSQPVATASTTAVTVHSTQYLGLRTLGQPATVSAHTLTYTPPASQPFLPGETIYYTVTRAVRGSTVTLQPASPWVGQLTAATGGTGQGNFAAAAGVPDPATGAGPGAVATADVDGDGDLDLLTANVTANTVSVRLNDGTGRFAPPAGAADLPVGTAPSALVLGDVDHDGDLDLLVAQRGDNTVGVYRNNGSGTFASTQTLAVGTAPAGLALGDTNGDGDLDLVVANSGSGTLGVCPNTGTASGTFGAMTAVAVGTGPAAVALADVDNDYDLDLLSANAGSNDVSICLNNGSNIFGGTRTVAVGTGPAALVLGDFDGDFDLDLAVANATAGTVSLRLNAGSGTFGGTTDLPGGGTALALGDVDHDSDLDLLSANATGTITVFRYFSTGQFVASPGAPAVALGTGAASLALADVDGDLDLDLLAATPAANAVAVRRNGPATLPPLALTSVVPAANALAVASTAALTATFNQPLLGASGAGLQVFSAQRGGRLTQGAGAAVSGNALSFAPPAAPFLPGETVQYSLTPAATSANGPLDRVRVGQFTVATGGSGRGNFAPGSTVPAGTNPFGVAVGDLDGDGDLDLVSANYAASSVSLSLNNGSGGYGGTTTLPTAGNAIDVSLADVDGDGDLDLLTAHNLVPGRVEVRRNDGSGGFAGPAQVVPVASNPYTVRLGDVDGDGDLDLLASCVVSGQLSGQVSIRRNDGQGSFDPSGPNVTVGNLPYSLALGDLDNDGDLDFAVANYQVTGAVSYCRNDGNGNFGTRTVVPVGTNPRALALADVDNDGVLDLLVASYTAPGTVSIRFNDGTGTFASNGTNLAVGSNPLALTLADVDADGDLDLLTANVGTAGAAGMAGTASLRFNTNAGAFGPSTDVPVGNAPFALATGDVDGDGDLDLLTADYGAATVSVRLNGALVAAATPASAGPALALFPNPARAAATLTGAAPHAPVALHDALGRLVLTATADASGAVRLVLPAGLPAGVYAVRSGTQVQRLLVE